MSLFQLKTPQNVTIYFQMGDITTIEVDAIINFVDSKLANQNALLSKMGTSAKMQFNQDWPKQYRNNSNCVVITDSGNLRCKKVMHIADLENKPENLGYFDALTKKISLCLQRAEKEKFKTVAFPMVQPEKLQNIFLESFHHISSNYRRPDPKTIYCVFGDGDKEFFDSFCKNHHVKLIAYKSPARKVTEVAPMLSVTPGPADQTDNCSICLCDFTDQKTLDKCGHSFCSACIDHSFSVVGPNCPICQTIYGEVIGLQPPGRMTMRKEKRSLPGFPRCGMYILNYDIPSGIQQKKHPNPGQTFSGTNRDAYLPDNQEGTVVLKMLQKAFRQKLIFTIGTSRTTNVNNTVTWNDIHHKTSIGGGPFSFGYPDPDYLKRVTLELEAKGINAKSVDQENIQNYLKSD